MLQLEKQSKQRISSANFAPNGNPNPLLMNPPTFAKSTPAQTTGPSPPRMHTPASPAAVRQSQSVPPASGSRTATTDQRARSSPSQEPIAAPSKPTDRPSILPRSQTLPALSIDVRISESMNPRKDSKTEMADDEESVTSEICQSPSWSDFGGNKRKKEKKRREQERREEEKRLKKEAKQQAADLKAGKRLSKKPPPAAMETQKMPAALRRNSIISFISSHSSSGENTRRHSREEKRLSVGSIDSTKGDHRSQSTPATSTEIRPGSSEGWRSVISPQAPQLPRLPRLGLGWHSRSGSSGTDKSKSWGSDDAYEKELVNFAYQFQASAIPSSPKDIVLDNVKVNQVSVHSPKRLSGAWPIGRSQTDSDLAKIKEHLASKSLPPVPRRDSSGEESIHGQPSSLSGHTNEASLKPQSKANASESSTRTVRVVEEYSSRTLTTEVEDKSLARHTHTTQRGSSSDGSSYVHKQRMHQQQLSIARFEDEQAVKLANEMYAEGDDVVDDSQISIPTEESTPPPQNQREHRQFSYEKPLASLRVEAPEPTAKKLSNEDVPHNQRVNRGNHVPEDLNKTPTSAQSPSSRNSRVDKILGFTRRQKPEQEKLSRTGKVSDSDKKVSRHSPPPSEEASSPPPVPSPQSKLDSVKVQQVAEAPKARHRRSETAEIVKPKEKEEEKTGSRQTHSRTRTSSSQLMNEDIQITRLLPRSTTAPSLTSEMKAPSAISGNPRNESPTKPEKKNVTFEKASTNNASGNAKQQEKAMVKTPEVVVESVGPEGVVRKTSIKRPRSNPNMQLAATNAQLPSFDFLPQLKHQPLPKRSPNRSSFIPSSSQFPAPIIFPLKSTSDSSNKLALSSGSSSLPSSPLRPESYAGPSTSADMSVTSRTHRRTMSPSAARVSTLGPSNVFGRTPTPSESVNAKPIAKLFVICCKCNFWHDLPSHIYEAMCMPKNLTRDPEGEVQDKGKKGKKVAEATLETMVKCPWCEHCMSTWCCAGWTAILYLQERHH